VRAVKPVLRAWRGGAMATHEA